jgi:dipeptidyl aminopeptidase/acylaminoacyl peptidase
MKVWDVATSMQLRTIKAHKGHITCVACSADGRGLASGSQDGTVKLWQMDTGKEITSLNGHTKGITSVAYSRNGRLASASEDRTVRLWDAATGKLLRTLEGHTGGVTSVAFSPDSRFLASASRDGSVRIWDAARGSELHLLKADKGDVLSIAYCPDGRELASAGSDKTVKLWDTATGRQLRTLRGHAAAVTSLSYSRDGQRIATASDDENVKVWDTATGEELCTLKVIGGVEGVVFSADGRRLAAIRPIGGSVLLWDGTDYRPAEQAARREAVAKDLPAWHRRQAEECEKSKAWFAAAFHLTRLLALQPKDEKLLVRRADAHRRQEQWLPAALDYSRALEVKTDPAIKEQRDRCLGRVPSVRAAGVFGLASADLLPLLPVLQLAQSPSP